jgi:ribonucleoside-diphosphate reductase alpha chain
LLWSGQIPAVDVTKLRPAGARLKTMGGRSSGPQPLVNLFDFTIKIFKNAVGRNLKPIECHDLMCKIGEVVVVGGVRRSAMISLSNINDIEMAAAKSGNWWENNPQRALSNNSVAYSRKPEMAQFIAEWKNLYDSKSGERGIYNVAAAQAQAARYGRRDPEIHYGTNPCSEIILRPYQFCNLSEVVLREKDTVDDVKNKVRLATILGTWQSTLTDFKYLRKIWKDNTEEERLLGVSLTGQFGHKFFSGQEGLDKLEQTLVSLRESARKVNAEEAKKIGIQESAAITCVKPSGTVSQLVGVSSGMHPWHSKYYIRTVRGSKTDPISVFLKEVGIPVEDDVMKPTETYVFSFPIKSPDDAIVRNDLTAIDHLNTWLVYQRAWCEHKPSITVSVKEDEWMEVGAWVYKNFDEVSGISFLPSSDHSYKQAPYQEITKKEYEDLLSKMPKSIRWEDLSFYETEDGTSTNATLACTSDGNCELVDISA